MRERSAKKHTTEDQVNCSWGYLLERLGPGQTGNKWKSSLWRDIIKVSGSDQQSLLVESMWVILMK